MGKVDIKSIANIDDDVHFRDDYMRLEGTNDILEDERFRNNKFTFTVQFAIIYSLDTDMVLIELPIGTIELRVETQDRVEVFYIHGDSEF